MAALKNPFDDAAFKAYLATLKKTRHPLLPDRILYQVEGDLIISEDDIRAQLTARAAMPPAQAGKKPEIIVGTDANGPAFWKFPGDRELKYAVARKTFPDQAKYQQLVTEMKAASADWIELCPDCGLSFEHVAALDTLEDPTSYLPRMTAKEITFVVQFSKMEGDPSPPIAFAFFPNNPIANRALVVTPQYFQLAGSVFSPRGVLRHELGHVLGYRHEHTRDGVQGCNFEDRDWKPLTDYDGNSVMHYPCGASSARGDLVLTETDREGHVKLYGPGSPFAPSDAVSFRPKR